MRRSFLIIFSISCENRKLPKYVFWYGERLHLEHPNLFPISLQTFYTPQLFKNLKCPLLVTKTITHFLYMLYFCFEADYLTTNEFAWHATNVLGSTPPFFLLNSNLQVKKGVYKPPLGPRSGPSAVTLLEWHSPHFIIIFSFPYPKIFPAAFLESRYSNFFTQSKNSVNGRWLSAQLVRPIRCYLGTCIQDYSLQNPLDDVVRNSTHGYFVELSAC